MDTYIHFQSATMEPCTTSRGVIEAATWVCTGCRMPRDNAANISVMIDRESLRAQYLTFVGGLAVGLINEAFLASFDIQSRSADLLLDPVFDLQGQIVEGWKAFRGKERVIIRGSKNVTCRICDKCGRNVYFAMGKRYLYPAPSAGRRILGSDLFGLVIPMKDYQRFLRKEWPGVTIDNLTVRESASDGLGAILWNSTNVASVETSQPSTPESR
jgi:hypothetical protein